MTKLDMMGPKLEEGNSNQPTITAWSTMIKLWDIQIYFQADVVNFYLYSTTYMS